MPIVPVTISQQIKSLIDATSQANAEVSKQQFADGLATIIATAILSATVVIPTGVINVVTNGSPTTQTGNNIAPAQGNLI
jgi:hypothetical protein